MQAHIARQPIFDQEKNVIAYELLFRSGVENVFVNPTDGDHASSSVISQGVFHIGLEQLTGGKKAFINFTESLLLQQFSDLLSTESIVVEILEDVEPTPKVLEAIKQIKEKGFQVALDDYTGDPKYQPFLQHIDILKVDMLGTEEKQLKIIADTFLPHGMKLLAEKVETEQDFLKVKAMGYSYFQGYFFRKPDIVTHKKIPQGKIGKLQLLKEINKPMLDMDALDDIIKRDVALSYKLLKYINSSSFGLTSQITSIKHAISLLGVNNMRKWASLVAMAELGNDKPSELIACALTRAKMCEALAEHANLNDKAQDLFLLGLFSLIDAMIDRPMPAVMKEMPLDEDIKKALLGQESSMRLVYLAVLAYERANWNKLVQIQAHLQLPEELIPQLYLESIEWVNNNLSLT